MISSDEDDESDDEEKAREEMQGFIAVSNYFISFYRGCPIIIWTGLNIKIGIVRNVNEWSHSVLGGK